MELNPTSQAVASASNDPVSRLPPPPCPEEPGVTLIFTLELADPPGPWQVNVKVVAVEIAGLVAAPIVA